MHHCSHCEQEIAQPIVVIADDPKMPSGRFALFFCCWECTALWFNKRAGEILMPDLDCAFFSSDEHMRKWG
jgi:hypothetical protein